jgi:hypothetical protein
MASVPVRLSARLASQASLEAKFQDRSMTDQVEHWARLGQIVEAAVSAATVARLKARSHDPTLEDKLAFARSDEGRAKAAALIASRNPVRYSERRGKIVKVTARQKKK